MQIIQNRRHFLAGAAAAGAAGLIGTSTPAWAEPPPETTSVRLPRYIGGAYCWAGLYIAGEMLRAEGFTDVRYVQGDTKVDHSAWIANGETDFSVNYVPIHLASIDAGVPIRVLAGLHSGCLELIANDSVKSITDLRGKRVGRLYPRFAAIRVGFSDGRLCRARSRQRHRMGHRRTQFCGRLRRRKVRCIPRPTAPHAGTALQENRPYDPQLDHRPAVVAAFLLHDFRDCGLCEQISGGDKARPAGHPQGRRPLCLGSVMERSAAGRSRFRPQLRTRAANA